MPPKLKVDELVEAFSDVKVAQAIAAAIMPHMRDYLSAIVKDAMDKFTTELQGVREELSSQNKKIVHLEDENALLRKQMDGMDADSRLSSLVFRGLPERTYAERLSGTSAVYEASSSTLSVSSGGQLLPVTVEATEKVILELCNNELQLDLKSSDIEVAYRMKGARAGDSRPVLVKFLSRKVRDTVYNHRRRLKHIKDSKIFISENLTKNASELFYEARKMQREKRLFGCWSASGNIFVKRTEVAKPVLFRDLSSLHQATRA